MLWGDGPDSLRNVNTIRVRQRGDCGVQWLESGGVPCEIRGDHEKGAMELQSVVWTPQSAPEGVPKVVLPVNHHYLQARLTETIKGLQPLGPHKKTFFVGILTGPKNRLLRDAQRASWLSDPLFRTATASYAFFIGKVSDPRLAARIQQESEQYGDIVRTPQVEGYYQITHKVMVII